MFLLFTNWTVHWTFDLELLRLDWTSLLNVDIIRIQLTSEKVFMINKLAEGSETNLTFLAPPALAAPETCPPSDGLIPVKDDFCSVFSSLRENATWFGYAPLSRTL